MRAMKAEVACSVKQVMNVLRPETRKLEVQIPRGIRWDANA